MVTMYAWPSLSTRHMPVTRKGASSGSGRSIIEVQCHCSARRATAAKLWAESPHTPSRNFTVACVSGGIGGALVASTTAPNAAIAAVPPMTMRRMNESRIAEPPRLLRGRKRGADRRQIRPRLLVGHDFLDPGEQVHASRPLSRWHVHHANVAG